MDAMGGTRVHRRECNVGCPLFVFLFPLRSVTDPPAAFRAQAKFESNRLGKIGQKGGTESAENSGAEFGGEI